METVFLGADSPLFVANNTCQVTGWPEEPPQIWAGPGIPSRLTLTTLGH
jgi:hypothetical protein